MKVKKIISDLSGLLSGTFQGFSDDKLKKLSGSLAYSTMFSMGPLLVVIIYVCGIFFGRDAVEGKVYAQLVQFLGSDTAMQLQEIIKKAALSGKSTVAITLGAIFLFVGATSIFSEIQDSVNDIWGIKPKPKKSWLKMIQNRFLSFSVIIGLGFLLLVSLMLTAVIDSIGTVLKAHLPALTVSVFYIINQVVTLAIVTFIFAVIFKVLPDAKIKWRDVFIGSVTTAILFMLGKLLISYYISKSNVGSSYGAAGSLIVLLLWIYYSSLILYLGAEFTTVYAIRYGSEILPNEYAVTKKEIEVETGSSSVQQATAAKPGDGKLA